MSGAAPLPLYKPTVSSGWQGAPGARFRVGPGTGVVNRALRPHAAAAPGFQPIPAGLYQPERDIELAQGKTSYQQQGERAEREKGYAQDEYGINQSHIGYSRQTGLQELATNRQRQQEAAAKTLAQLKESYAKLGVRQEEGANKAGVLTGGALLQSAAKRGANEGIQKGNTETALRHQMEADDFAKQKAEHGWQESEGSNVFNKEKQEGALGETLTNSEANRLQFEQGIENLKQHEAVERFGYQPLASSPIAAAANRAAKPKAPARRPVYRGNNRKTGPYYRIT